jgi:hypothetical protein
MDRGKPGHDGPWGLRGHFGTRAIADIEQIAAGRHRPEA